MANTKRTKPARGFRFLVSIDEARDLLAHNWSAPVEVHENGLVTVYHVGRGTCPGEWLVSKAHPDGCGVTAYTVVVAGRSSADWSCNHDQHVWASGTKWACGCKHVCLLAAALSLLEVTP